MVRAETYASKWALPRKAASAAPSCMVNVPFHFYCPKELLVGISQSSQRGDEMNHCHCSGVQQCSSPTFSGAHLPFLPTYFFQLHLSLDSTLEIGLKVFLWCSILVMGKFFMGYCQTSVHQALAYTKWGRTLCPASKHFSRDYTSTTFSYSSCWALPVEAKLSGNWQQTQKFFLCCPCPVTSGSFTIV